MTHSAELKHNQIVTRHSSIIEIRNQWDALVKEPFQTSEFLTHLEKTNPCNQRYYTFYKDQKVYTAAVVYSLDVNLFTYFKSSAKAKMCIIGIPASVDSSGIIGSEEFFPVLISEILKTEKGIVLCLNFEKKMDIPKLVCMHTLPTYIFHNQFKTFEDYLSQMRSNHRRTVLRSMELFQNVTTYKNSCDAFTDEHYQLYLNIMQRTKTKLEILPFPFFKELPNHYILTDYRDPKGTILSWHITASFHNIYAFLFGGIHYQFRDQYDSYYNNLLGIYKEGIEAGFSIINFGQTAAQPKTILGAEKVEKLMFVYHKNRLIRSLFRLCSGLLTYKDKTISYRIFK